MHDLMSGATRCLLVQPRFSSHSFWNYSSVCGFLGAKYPAAPLGLMTVAALLPQQWQFRLVDENVRPLTDADLEWADIVLASGMVTQQLGVLGVIERAHNQGKPVVVGGPDATSQPRIYEMADYLVLGEGEVTIPSFVEDLAKNAASGQYQSSLRADMTQAVVPRYDLIRFADYLHVGVQFSRGCPYNCEFCDIIELFGRVPRCKTPDQMLSELQTLYDLGYRGHIDFVDDNFIGNKSKVIEVLQAVRDWSEQHRHPFYFSTEASINLAKEQELLRLMQENDFRYVFVGIESPDEDVLAQTQKRQNTGISVVEAVRTLAAHGLIVNGGFILGLDGESEDTAGHMIDLIQAAGICMAMVGMLAALPNTQLSRRLEREGRLFGEGLNIVDSERDVDQTIGGLNFCTARPRTDVLQDQAEVLRQIYDPRRYYERVLMTAAHLNLAPKSRLGLDQALRLAWGFLKVSRYAGLSRHTGSLYWSALARTLVRNRRALESVVNLAAMYTHFADQSAYAIRVLEEQVEYIRSCGEQAYNALMTDKHREAQKALAI